jgi:hypothetical protein
LVHCSLVLCLAWEWGLQMLLQSSNAAEKVPNLL